MIAQKSIPHPMGVFLQAKLTGGGGDQPTDLEAFIDSEAAGNFINEALVTHLGLPVDPLPYPIPVLALDG